MAKRTKSRRETLSSPKNEIVAVVGLGRVGLPLALFLASKGHHAYGIDVDQEKVNTVARGQMPFMEDGAPELLKKHVNKTLHATTDFASISKSKIIILTLGTPVDENM